MLWAVVPVKKLAMSKQRMSGVLSQQQRKTLCLSMLFDVLNALVTASSVQGVFVVTSDEEVEAAVKKGFCNVGMIKEKHPPSLNGAISYTTSKLLSRGARKILVAHGDLPLITANEINELALLSENNSVVITPDYRLKGTNALLLNPLNVIRPSFGNNSFKKHLKQAEEKRVNYHIYRPSNLNFDMDYPRDLLEVLARGEGTKTYDALQSFNGNLKSSINSVNSDLIS